MNEHRRRRKEPLLITLQLGGHFAVTCGGRFAAGLTADEALGTAAQWIYTSKMPRWMTDRTPTLDNPEGA